LVINMKTSRLLLLSTFLLPLSLAGCDGDADDGAMNDGDTDDSGDGDGDDEGTETGDPGPLDADEDGLTDEEEAELGTDPNKKDSDGDNYWDPWELTEGTDPLQYDSRIYEGFWPYNPHKDTLEQGNWGTTGTQVGDVFPRQSFMDHNGDYVDIYDFTNFSVNETNTPAYFIFDLSAQWCGPCHNVANWIAGVDSPDTAWIQTAYPTVREKVHGLRIWWVTFIVQDQAGGPPTIADAETWYTIHKDPYIPIMVDETQEVQNGFLGPAFPHFFLLDPTLRIEYFPSASAGSNEDPYPAVGLVDKHL
jgi:hypothetical protein